MATAVGCGREQPHRSAYDLQRSTPGGTGHAECARGCDVGPGAHKLANFTRSTPALGPVEASRDIAVDGIFGPQTKRWGPVQFTS